MPSPSTCLSPLPNRICLVPVALSHLSRLVFVVHTIAQRIWPFQANSKTPPILINMTQPKEIAPDLQEGIDRKLLKQLRERFLEVNHGRLERMLSTLSVRHRMFLESLPLLLHINHPSLPGYVSGSTPNGVCGFTPNKANLRAASSISRSFAYRKRPLQQERIFSIFLMGSTGTVAHSDTSDMDIWICYDPALSQGAVDELQDKLHGIEVWADSIGLEVHFFLMDPIKFRNGVRSDLSGEDCGSAQHYLLLDEFYRTSIMVAGRYPLWWMIPAYDENRYTEIADMLLRKRFLKPDDCVDFGGISDFPAGEFIGAGMWQLYKGIDSPYKSVIKIVLTEVYASEYPNVESLSIVYKKKVYAGNLDLDELDPYVMLYRKIENYLIERKELRRLELIRHCFYFKVNESLSRTPNQVMTNWRRQVMLRLVREWGWNENYIQQLDNRRYWKVNRVSMERQELVQELNHSYRFLSSFARENNIEALIKQEDMNILGRKLYAAFERKGGKIELVNPGITASLVEEHLSFHYVRDEEHGINNYWAVFSGYLKEREARGREPTKKGRSIIELISWCYFNKLLDQTTRLSVEDNDTDMTEHELQQTVQSFFQIHGETLPYAPQQNFDHSAFPTKITLYINAGIDPMRPMTLKGIHRLSDQSDALSYSAFHHNLAITVDQVTFNSWGEIICSHYSGENALIDCLVHYMRQIPPDGSIPLPRLDVRCYCPSRASAIALRVEELFRDIISCYYSGTRSLDTRYILEIEQFIYMLQFRRNTPYVRGMRNYKDLIEALGESQPQYSQIVVDRNALVKHPLRMVAKMGAPGRIQAFYQSNGDQADIFIHDELGSIFFTQKNYFDEKTVLNPIRHFLENIQLRRSTLDRKDDIPSQKVAYYYISRNRRGDMQTRRKEFKALEHDEEHHSIQAIAQTGTFGDVFYTIYCDNQEFSQLEYGDALFAAVAGYIASLRRNREQYPCYITDLDLSQLDLPQGEQLQTVQFLQHKEKLESAINSALRLA
ncbi:MAG: class I adenylate cyclase [Ketobacter sp.]|nr:MAG: class I adenylate cyclase [Ketobacter sp.]